MKTWVRHTAISQPSLICRSCDQPIVALPHVGWVLDVRGANTYDLCEGDALGNHTPRAPRVTTTPATPTRGAGGNPRRRSHR